MERLERRQVMRKIERRYAMGETGETGEVRATGQL
jgi:hypothetical protein